MAQPSVADVRVVDPVLTDLSIGFKNDRFLWEKMAPVKKTTEQTGTFFLYTRDFWFKNQAGAERAPEGPYLRVGFGTSTDTFKCLEYGYEKLIGKVVQAASQTPDELEPMSVAFVTNLLELQLEKLVAAETFVTGKWGTSTTLAGSNQWSDYADSDPIADADLARRTIKRNTGVYPNSLFLGVLGWEKLKEHPLILDKYKYTQKSIMTPELVAAVLDIDEIVIGDSVENTAAEGATFVGADIWTDNAVWMVRNTPGLLTPNGAVSFIWDERDNVPWAVDRYEEDSLRSTVVRTFTHFDPRVVSSEHGYMLLDLVA